MVLVDFQAVEGQLIFFVRDSASYKIKNYWDLVETAEGLILNLRDGLDVVQGERRELISLPVNNIMKKHYETSEIYYNTYEKELMYFYGEGTKKLMIFRFETGTWADMDYAGVTINGDITDIVDDYEGSMYVVSGNSVYKLEYNIDTIGYFGLTNVDLQELNYKKRLCSITTDVNGYIIVNGLKPNVGDYNKRTVTQHNKMLSQRKPGNWIDFSIGFKGTFYNLEMDLEVFSRKKT
jgi:hypothetical protein